MLLRIAFSALLLLNCVLPTLAADWPAFRGIRGDGTTQEGPFPTRWDRQTNIKWKVALPTPANGSPIVSNGRVFLTCADDEGRQRSLFCYDRSDGKQLWVKTVRFGKIMPTHKTNPYAGSTPAADGKRVVVWHSSAGLYCYNFAGNELWKRDLGEFRHIWGYGTSPVIHGESVILNSGPGARIFLTSIDLETGETNWETVEPQDGTGEKRATDGGWMGSWSMPIIASAAGDEFLVCTLPTRVNGYDPETGELLWWCEGIRGNRGDLAYSSPLVHNGFCVATGGFSGPSIGFKIAGSGNITASRSWRVEKNPQSIGSGVFLGDYIYKPNAGPGTLQCLDAATGKVMWTSRGAGGADHWGSIVAARDTLYVTNQQGTTVVFKANPEKFEPIAENKLEEHCNSTPALSDGEVFIRTHEHLFCIHD